MLTRRNFLMTGAAVATAGSLSEPREARAAANTLNIGYIADFPNASVFAIAQDQKLWDAEGLKPDVKVFTNGPIQIQAMGAGSLDFGTIGPGALWLPASGRAKVVGINDIGFSDRVIVQAGIGSIQDLKGKKVGVPQGTSGDMILRLSLAKAGMSISDVQIVPMDPSTVVAAFSSKQIDAAGIWYPLVSVIKDRVPDMTELAKNGDFYPALAFPSAFVSRNEVPDELSRKVIAVLKMANEFRATRLDQSIAITSKFIGVPADKLAVEAQNSKFLTNAELQAQTKDGTAAGWLTKMNDMFKDFGRLPNPLDPKEYFRADLYTAV